ncbi:hypothetical protein BACPLE_00106 [Phocaeicola plebeius DSM 17135]|uniref:Uncharacterized protein n=1 Tax=Phocaeicola plebeius (strain DSM 17135 / JCM 12973 / CCUG 54634 / M2) TaxID=484018 RepID=B5CTM9_PHOPM|nr:hypothetical protein BACPLE_00106 [Phocaeicola plebeius DSM 17135]
MRIHFYSLYQLFKYVNYWFLFGYYVEIAVICHTNTIYISNG